MRRLLLASCLTLASACASPYSAHGSVSAFPPAAPRAATPVVVTQLVDLRPERLRSFHEPARSKSIGAIVGIYFYFGWERDDGPRIWGDERTTIALPGGPPLAPTLAAARFVERVVGDASGGNATVVEATVDPTNVDAAAALAPGGEGVVVVPLLDQLDLVQLESQQNMVGGGSSTEDNGSYTVTTTTSGGFGDAKSTERFGNARIRLVLVRVRGGKVVARSVVYAAGASHGIGGALARTGPAMAQGVAGFVGAAVLGVR